MKGNLLTRKVGDIPNEPDKKESKGDPISTPRLVIKNELRNLYQVSVLLHTNISSKPRPSPRDAHQQEDPRRKTDAAKDPR